VARTNYYLHSNHRAWRWSQEEIVDGLILHGFSRRAYKYLAKKKLLPLPGESTLRNWLKDFPCRAGIETDLLDILSSKLTGDLPDDYRDCILSFERMPLKSSPEQNQAGQDDAQASAGSSKRLLLVVLRGLFYEWRMPIFYDVDRVNNKTLLLEIISAAESHGARVRGVAGILINKLGPANPFVPNPSDPEKKVFFFPDVPFLLKILRNKVLDPGIVLEDGSEMSMRDFEPLIRTDDDGVKVHPKLTTEHLYFFGQVPLKVAVELLSLTTASVMRNLFPKKATQAAFIELVDSW